MAENTHLQISKNTAIGAGVLGAVSAVRNAIEEVNRYQGILLAFGDTADGKAARAAALEMVSSDDAVTVLTRLTNVQSGLGHPYFVQLLNDLGQ